MKKNIYLYLFVFMALIALYQYVSATHMLEDKDGTIVKIEAETKQLQDSIQKLQIKQMDLQYFSLENNDDALAYYDNLKLKDPSRYIADKLLETNEQKGNNPLVPYEGMDGNFKINKIKLLNHKWIIADFSDGKYWGELLIKYELKDDLGVDFTLMDHLLYSKS